jgi:hypothetical protein
MRIDLESMAIELPHVAGHPNRLPCRGVLTLLDVPSDKAPAGARGHRVMLTRAAAEKALPSLLGMALDFTPNLDGHDARRKVGVITSADIVAADSKWQNANRKNCDAALREQQLENPTRASAWLLEIAGYIFARDFPEIVELIGGRGTAEPTLRQKRAKDGAPGELGMSYEIANARVADVNAAVWTLTEATFTGAAMLLRSKAAYAATWIELEETTHHGSTRMNTDPLVSNP